MDVIVYDGKIVDAYAPLLRRPCINEIMKMETNPKSESSFKLECWKEYWRTLTENDKLMPRHMEMLVKASTELVTAEEDCVYNDQGTPVHVHAGLIYPAHFLKGHKYSMRISNRDTCLARGRKPVAAFTKQYFKMYAGNAVFERIKNNPYSDISMGIIGNYTTMKKEFSMGTEGAKLTVPRQQRHSEFVPLTALLNEEETTPTSGEDMTILSELLNNRKSSSGARRKRRRPSEESKSMPVATQVMEDETIELFDFNAIDPDEDEKTKHFTADEE
jgi:hypothetical protein